MKNKSKKQYVQYNKGGGITLTTILLPLTILWIIIQLIMGLLKMGKMEDYVCSKCSSNENKNIPHISEVITNGVNHE